MMKKRIILVCLCFALFVVLAACGVSKLSNFAPDDPLVTIDGEVLMTVQDFLYLKAEQTLQKEYFGSSALSEKELFELWAERYILGYLYEHYADGKNEVTRGSVETDFDGQLAELKENPTVYEKDLAYIEAYKEETGLDDAGFRDWSVDHTLLDYEIDALLVDIMESFPTVTDSDLLQEYLIETIYLLVKDQEVAVFYPGLLASSLNFEKGIS